MRGDVREQVEILSVRSLERLWVDRIHVAVEQDVVLGICLVNVELYVCVIGFGGKSAVHRIDAGIYLSVRIGEAVAFEIRARVVVSAAVGDFAFVPPCICADELCSDVVGCLLCIRIRVVDGVVAADVDVFVVLVSADGHFFIRKVAIGERNLGYADSDGHFKCVHNLAVFAFRIPDVNGHRSFERCAEVFEVACLGRVLVRDVIVADVTVCELERHRIGQSVCADVCEVVVIDVLLGHTRRLVVDDIDVSAVATLANERIRYRRILARIGVEILKTRVVEFEFSIDDGALKHGDGNVDALFCKHITSCAFRQLEVCIGLSLELEIIFERNILFTVADIRKNMRAVCMRDGYDCGCHICGVARAVLDEFVNVGPVEVCVEYVAAHGCD